MLKTEESKLEQMSAASQRELLHLTSEAIEKCETIRTQMPRVYIPWRR